MHGSNPTCVTAHKLPFPDSRIMLPIFIILSITKFPPEQRVDQDGMIRSLDRSSTITITSTSTSTSTRRSSNNLEQYGAQKSPTVLFLIFLFVVPGDIGDHRRTLAKNLKSFRLDTDSIKDAIDSWPVILVAVALCGLFATLGWSDATWRVTLIAFGAIYFGYAFRGSLTQNLRSKYPDASCMSLLSICSFAVTFGLLVRMIFPTLQGGFLDYVWLSISFTALLAFVVINRRDPDVL